VNTDPAVITLIEHLAVVIINALVTLTAFRYHRRNPPSNHKP
jgi:hypothetical protein